MGIVKSSKPKHVKGGNGPLGRGISNMRAVETKSSSVNSYGLRKNQIQFLVKLNHDKEKTRWPYIIVFIFSIAMIAVGGSYWDECKFDCPLFLVLMGSVALVASIIGIFSICTKYQCYDFIEPIFGITAFAILIWGSVIVFGYYSAYDYEDKESEYYCHHGTMSFTFALIVTCWVLFPCTCCCCCVVACTGSCNPKIGTRHGSSSTSID